MRDEEAEAQRKARSRHARQSRRSTQVQAGPRGSPLKNNQSWQPLNRKVPVCFFFLIIYQGGDADGPAGGGEDDEDGQQRERKEGRGEGSKAEESRGRGEGHMFHLEVCAEVT